MPDGTCYEDACRFVIKEEEGELVHGSVTGADGRTVEHAWVELPTGYVWEPETRSFITIADFKARFKASEKQRYSATDAAIMALGTGNFGPWTAEEKHKFLGRSEGGEELYCDCCGKLIPPEEIDEARWWYDPELHTIICCCKQCYQIGKRPIGAGG